MTLPGPRARRPRGPSLRARLARVLLVVAVAAVAAVGFVAYQTRVPERPGSACLAAADAAGGAPGGSVAGEGWTAAWGVATQAAVPGRADSAGVEARTLRQPARLSLGGRQLRVRVSNAFGDRPLVVGAATVARCSPDGGARTRGPLVPVTWSGRGTTSVPVGASATSDPVDLPVPAGSDVLVSLFLPGPTGPVTWRPTAWTRTFAADGDATRSDGDGYRPAGSAVSFLDGVDVLTPSVGTVVALGDSITEGCCSPSFVDAHVSWPDVLATRLARLPVDRRMAVVDAGISANQLLADRAGQRMTSRVQRDVLDRPGVRTVILLGGVNDLILSDGAVSADALVAGYRSVLAQAHGAGVRVVGATILPFGGSGLHTDRGEATRQAVNTWIRTSGELDAVADLDATTRDPDDPTRLRTAFDSGDGLHPNATGYAAMGDAIRLADLLPGGAPVSP